eukprot:gene3734-4304_t
MKPVVPACLFTPTASLHTLSLTNVTKKLKREFEQIIPKDEWETYFPNGKTFSLFNSKSDLTNTFGFKVKRTDKNIQFSDLDSAWILYRQNRFQVDCDLVGSLESWSNTDRSGNVLYVNNDDNILNEVTGLYFTLYVLKFSSAQITATSPTATTDVSDRVPIHQLGNASGKKDGRLPVDPCPVVKGKANWTKLQFGSATANNARINPEQPNPNQQFFRIVVTLNAVIDSSAAATSSPTTFSSIPSPSSKFFPLQSKISPPMIVRGQNPGRFLNHDKSCKKDSASSPNSSPNSSSNNNNNLASTPMIPIHEPVTLKATDVSPWTKHPLSDEIIYTNGKVGINTNNPTQALTVNGNILVTGELFKPSDRRIKTNIRKDSSNHWDKINKLKLYEYDRKKMLGYDVPFGGDESLSKASTTVREKGFLAQELREVLPNAVTVAGEVRLQDGTTIPNLLVVNDRVILLENIGATQQIGRTLKKEQDHIIEMDKEINRVKIGNTTDSRTLLYPTKGKRDQHAVLTKMQDLVSFMLSEEDANAGGNHVDDSCIYCSIMGLGPAWTMWIFGWFFPFFFIVGSFYLFSPSRVKWISGLVNFITMLVVGMTIVLLTFYVPNLAGVILIPSLIGIGIFVCIVVGFFRQRTWDSKKRYLRERMKLMQTDGYQNINEHIDRFRGQYRHSARSASSQSIDMMPISEMYTTSSRSSLNGSRSSIGSLESFADIDNFREISQNNHKALQEIPLQKIVMDYGKKQPVSARKSNKTTRYSAPPTINVVVANNHKDVGLSEELQSPKSRQTTFTTTSTTTTTTTTTEPVVAV